MRKFTDAELKLAPQVAEVMGKPLFHDGARPTDLPLEHDCLEWLLRNGWYPDMRASAYESDMPDKTRYRVFIMTNLAKEMCEKYGSTLLEALYRAILEIT